jgi:hypothetical protein
MDEVKKFAHENGLVVSQHFISADENPKFTMWINSDDPNATRIVIPVCEEEAFIEATQKIIDAHEAELKSREGKKRYLVGVRECHINHIRVVAENEDAAKKLAKQHQADEGSMYTEYNSTLAEDLWSVEEIGWEE